MSPRFRLSVRREAEDMPATAISARRAGKAMNLMPPLILLEASSFEPSPDE
jgi:hypothetical protein